MLYTGSPVNGINRGVAIDSVKLELGTKHTEANSLASIMGPQNHYLGLMKLWDQYQILQTPIISATELAKNVLYTNTLGESLSYSVKTKYALPYVVVDINGDGDKLGVNREDFFLVLSTNNYTPGDILTYDEYNGKQAVVKYGSTVEPYGAGSWLYTMRLTSGDPKQFISRRFVQPGVEWWKIGFSGGEFTKESSAITNDSDGLETLMFKTGNDVQSVEHSITGHAMMIDYKVNNTGIDQSLMGNYRDPHMANVIYLMDTLRDQNQPNDTPKKIPVAGSGMWIPTIMYMLYQEQAKMQERHYMFSDGGVIEDGRGHLIRRGMGYYPQLKSSSNYHTFSKPEQIGPLVRQVVGDLFFGRKDLRTQDRKVRFKMGIGAVIEMEKYFKANFEADIRFPIWGQHPALSGMLTGDNMNLHYDGFRFTSYRFPEVGTVEIVHDPSLDWTGTKNQSGFIGMYPSQSYRIFVEDLTAGSFSNAMPSGNISKGEGFDNGSNMTLIKPRLYADVYTSYKVGKHCPDFLRTYIGAGTNTHIRSDDSSGLNTTVEWCGEVWLKDPSRVILLEMADPLRTI